MTPLSTAIRLDCALKVAGLLVLRWCRGSLFCVHEGGTLLRKGIHTVRDV